MFRKLLQNPAWGKIYSVSVLFLLLSGTAPVWADSVQRASNASRLSALSVTSGVKGSTELLSAGGELVVASVEKSGESIRIVLQKSTEGSEVSLTVSAASVGGLSLLVGDSVTLVADAVGWLLLKGGEVVAYIPNELGKSLLHHSKHGAE